jgi:hypothetical protein
MNLHYTKLNLEFSVDEADQIRNDFMRLLKDKGLSEEDIEKYRLILAVIR